MKKYIITTFLIIFSINSFALNLDCDGKIFKNLESDVDTEVTNDRGGLMQTTIAVTWSELSLNIKEDMLSSIMPKADLYNINRKDLSYVKSEIRLGEDTVEKKGQCKIWEKPAGNVI